MRKLILISVAIVIVSVFAAALLASGEILSFYAPESDTSEGVKAPADQAQPQDFDREDYYFGPDFMCVIYGNSAVDCFGSDAHGVVSGVPSGDGFTRIDGGDTYACAYQRSTRFTYCWGSIERSPSVIEPTATPTPEPTATALPPGVTPEPTATAEPFGPCRIRMPTDGRLPATIEGSWIEECVYTVELDDVAAGSRYYGYVAFRANRVLAPWVATLTSEDADTYMVLWERVDGQDNPIMVASNDDIARDNTNSRIEWTPVEGKVYVIDMTTYTANTLGDFTLTLESSASSAQGAQAGQSTGHSAFQETAPFERRQ